MKVFLLRHGHAEPFAVSDAVRPLSTQGKAEVSATVEGSKVDLQNIDHVWVSPLLRAQQTWAVASGILDHVPQVTTRSEVIPEGSIVEVLKMIENSKAKNLLIVTHQPFVGSLLDGLCGLDKGRCFMGTAHLAAVELTLPCMGLGNLLWLRSPNSNNSW